MFALHESSDDELAARGREGEAAAMAALFERHAPTLRRALARFTEVFDRMRGKFDA